MKISVLGAGNSGLGMVAHLGYLGCEVRLWNRTFENIRELHETNSIQSTGVVTGTFPIKFVSSDLNEVVKGTDLIIVTTPASAHKDIAIQLRNCSTDIAPVLLSPGRTFGIQNFKHNLGTQTVMIAEAQTVVHTCRALSKKNVHFFAIKEKVKVACENFEEGKIFFEYMPKEFRKHYELAESWIETSLGNVGMVLHCAPMMFNVGWVESNSRFKYYSEGITPRIARVLEKLDNERVAISVRAGVKVPSLCEWLKFTYGAYGEDLYTCLRSVVPYQFIDAPSSMNHRYVTEDVAFGLVPLERLGKELGISTSTITTIIDGINLLCGDDFRAASSGLVPKIGRS